MSAVPNAAEVRPASSVMLLRDAAAGLEVFTLQRVSQMVFAGGMTVFPGGGVEPSDADEAVPWVGPEAGWWARAFRVGEPAARGAVVAAARELYEETGVLLASGVLGSGAREALTSKRASLAELLRDRAMVLRADLLRPWARWITPPGPPRRYDTFFFLAELPAGSDPDWATSEASAGSWRRPADLLDAGNAGEIALMPPTVAMLTDLAAAGEVGSLLAVERTIDVVAPERPRP